MTDIQQVEGAAVVSWDNWGDQYSGPSQGVPSMSLQQIFEYGAEPHVCRFDVACAHPAQGVMPTRILRAPYLANTRNEKSKARHRAVRRGLKGLFR